MFYLVDNQELDFASALTSSKSFSASAKITCKNTNVKGSSGDSDGVTKFNKFQHAFDRQFGEQLKWPLTIQFLRSEVKDSAGELHKWDIVLQGDILRAVHQVLHYGNNDEPLQIRLVAKCVRNDSYYGQTSDVASIDVADFLPDCSVDLGDNPHTFYQQGNVLIPTLPPVTNGRASYSKDTWKISVEISGNDFIYLADILPRFGETNRKIFTERKHCDFKIVSGGRTPISCHKAFLCARSPVLSRMLDGNFKEAKKNEMKMPEMSTVGVTALLEFIYCDDLHQAMKSSAVSLELLKAADEYDIPVLWNAIATILKEKPHAWYDVDVAIHLFDFLRNKKPEDGQQLMKKMIRVLALKPDQLSKSSVFGEVFRNPVSKDMFQVALEANIP